MFYSRRKRLDALDAQEAAGQSLWTPSFSAEARTKVLYAVADASRQPMIMTVVMQTARNALLRDEGLAWFGGHRTDVVRDMTHLVEVGEDSMIPTAIEALLFGLLVNVTRATDPDLFVRVVNEILAEHRIAFELIDAKMIEFESKEMHQEVVAPTLRLLSGRSGWESVEAAYQKSLSEIAADPSDAVTDAGTALQETLVALGCSGNALGPLIASAKSKGLLAPHDLTLATGIEKIMVWVSADRSVTGDTHNAAPASPEDAWFAVHVVGAVILRLASGGARS